MAPDSMVKTVVTAAPHLYAIRIPANDSLERHIAELLTRPVGRPSHKPVVRYKGFLYQAASWKTARRVVAKVEFHVGELFPRVRFIVTSLGLSYNSETPALGRGRMGHALRVTEAGATPRQP